MKNVFLIELNEKQHISLSLQKPFENWSNDLKELPNKQFYLDPSS